MGKGGRRRRIHSFNNLFCRFLGHSCICVHRHRLFFLAPSAEEMDEKVESNLNEGDCMEENERRGRRKDAVKRVVEKRTKWMKERVWKQMKKMKK